MCGRELAFLAEVALKHSCVHQGMKLQEDITFFTKKALCTLHRRKCLPQSVLLVHFVQPCNGKLINGINCVAAVSINCQWLEHQRVNEH